MAVRKIELMHQIFGLRKGYKCAECENFVSGMYHNKKLQKCKVYGMTHSEASDWRQKYDACGMFNREYSGTDIIRLVTPDRNMKKISQPLENQIDLFGGNDEC